MMSMVRIVCFHQTLIVCISCKSCGVVCLPLPASVLFERGCALNDGSIATLLMYKSLPRGSLQ